MIKKRKRSLALAIISGIVAVIVLASALTGMVGYLCFDSIIAEEYEDDAYKTAVAAAMHVDGGKLDEYLAGGENNLDYMKTFVALHELCENQDCTFIYVIVPDEDYSHITFVFSTASASSGFTPFKTGYVRETTNNEYATEYRKIMKEGKQKSMIIRDQGDSSTGKHVTELIPIKDSEKVTGILAVQRQIEEMQLVHTRYIRDLMFSTLVPILLVIIFYGLYLKRRLLSPIMLITNETERFAMDNSKPEKPLSSEIMIKDEIGVLAESIDRMIEKTLDNMKSLTEATAARQKVDTQLGVAKSIQKTSIPGRFPAFPDRDDFDIYASMTPALEVGGDFYNFFLVDDDHLAMVIADVSDKGIGAALFMMSSNILIENRARLGGTPSEILEFTNNRLCARNEMGMFVTVWMGILELSTGKAIAANAGHEFPIIRLGDGKFHKYDDSPHSMMLGIMDGLKFKDYTFELPEGAALFLYTDGVPESENAVHDQFGTSRTVAALNKAPDASPRELIENVSADIHEFINGVAQFDDTTMLCVKRAKKADR